LSQLFSYELPVPHYKMNNKTTVHNIVSITLNYLYQKILLYLINTIYISHTVLNNNYLIT